ncbi:hypothetical protein FP744_10009210 [Trichoderma asperellum]|nr:hypothetical protein LI328DRAFT_171097 [Trichoderma asperelloides]
MASSETPIVLYYYELSPYSKQVVWYLALKGLKFQQCIQPRIMPRPDLSRLGVKYRRIPVLTIGRDIYLDTRHIISKLSELEPGKNARLSVATTPEQKALQRLLQAYMIDSGLSRCIVQLILHKTRGMMDPEFIKDRTEFMSGASFFPPEALEAMRPDTIRRVKDGFEFLEQTLLSDGREWLLGTAGPTIGDIEMAWPLLWLERVPGARPEECISEAKFPKVFAWMDRFKSTAQKSVDDLGELATLTGEEAAKLILSSDYHEADGYVDETDVLVQQQNLKKGQLVRMWPTDTGSNHKDLGQLVSVTDKEVVIEAKAEDGGLVRIHAQRHGFAVAPCEES